MVSRISKHTKKELIGALRERYQVSTKKEKTRILDDFSALTGYHRKHAVRLLGGHPVNQQIKHRYSRRIYN